MRAPMAMSRRLTDGTRWRTFMRLRRLDELMASYTSAGARGACGELARVRLFTGIDGCFSLPRADLPDHVRTIVRHQQRAIACDRDPHRAAPRFDRAAVLAVAHQHVAHEVF